MLSLTGGPFSKRQVLKGASSSARAAVVLLPSEPAAEHGVRELHLGGPCASHPLVVNAGTELSCCDAILPEGVGAARLQCQFALRSFEDKGFPGQTHEALFLRDVAEDGDAATLVNGSFAFKPWQWLHDGDEVALSVHLESSRGARKRSRSTAICSAEAWPLYVVRYQRHVQKARAEAYYPGEEIVGSVVDVTYLSPPATYRVRVVSFDFATGWHHVDSHGYCKAPPDEESDASDESFTDELNLGGNDGMVAKGLVVFVDDASQRASDDEDDAPLSSFVGAQSHEDVGIMRERRREK